MGNRSLRISAFFAATFFAIQVIAVAAAPTASQDDQPVVRIVMPGDSVIITQDLTPETAGALRMSKTEGVLVRGVMGNPLRAGDVILSVNGTPIRCQAEL